MAADERRRAVLAGIASAAASSVLGCGSHSGSSRNSSSGGERERPNFLILLADDPSPQFFGAYGDPLASTPNVDGLARDGILFKNFFSTAPVCAPTRFGILTGLHAESCGPAHHMRAQGKIPEWLVGFPTYLQEAGYWTSYTGKEDYNAPLSAKAGYNSNTNVGGGAPSPTDPAWTGRPPGASFFSFVNYVTCHEFSAFVPRPGLVLPTQVRVPAYLPDTLLQRLQIAGYYNNLAQTDLEIGLTLARLKSDGLYGDTIIMFFSDNGGVLPRSKRHCYDGGFRVPMIMRFPPKWAHLAPAAAGTVIEQPATTVDIAPTVLSLAGLDIPDYMHGQAFAGPQRRARRYAFGGRNRMDERYDFVRTVRSARFRYIRNYMPHLIYGLHVAFMWQLLGYKDWETQWLAGTLDETQSRFWKEKPKEELYDIESDPDEVRNLIADPAYAAVAAELRNALDLHMAAINDNGFIPEGAAGEGYDESRAPGVYPLIRIMVLAELASRRDASLLPAFEASLQDANEVVRFWAAMGALMLGDAAAASRDALAQRLTGDESVHVRIVAAEALVRLGEGAAALAFLADTLKNAEAVSVRLQAMNSIANVGQAASPVLPDLIQVVATESDTYVRNAALYSVQVLTGTYTPATAIYAGSPLG